MIIRLIIEIMNIRLIVVHVMMLLIEVRSLLCKREIVMRMNLMSLMGLMSGMGAREMRGDRDDLVHGEERRSGERSIVPVDNVHRAVVVRLGDAVLQDAFDVLDLKALLFRFEENALGVLAQRRGPRGGASGRRASRGSRGSGCAGAGLHSRGSGGRDGGGRVGRDHRR